MIVSYKRITLRSICISGSQVIYLDNLGLEQNEGHDKYYVHQVTANIHYQLQF